MTSIEALRKISVHDRICTVILRGSPSSIITFNRAHGHLETKKEVSTMSSVECELANVSLNYFNVLTTYSTKVSSCTSEH